MLNYYEMKENYEIIKDFCKKYRKEITITSGLVVEKVGVMECSAYIEFMNELSFDTFLGNQLAGLIIEGAVDLYKTILNGEITYNNFIKENLNEIYDEYIERLELAQD